DFAKLANEFTDDIPARAAKSGGNMGYSPMENIKQSPLFAPLAPHLENMKEGEVCKEPIRTKFGWHIIKLVERQEPGVASFEEIKDDLKKHLAEQNSTIAINKWLMIKRKTVPINISKQFDALLTRYE